MRRAMRSSSVALSVASCSGAAASCTSAFSPAALRTALREAGISADPMSTGAAVRTYNVLLAEDRAVAAALIAVD